LAINDKILTAKGQTKTISSPIYQFPRGAVMKDLVVCVGETCHQSGAEQVLKSFMGQIAQKNLEKEISLKGSFCISSCCEKDKVSIRVGENLMFISPDEADSVFASTIWPTQTTSTEG
jgi:NADH:ubiquinone oxidoreductase subunit E